MIAELTASFSISYFYYYHCLDSGGAYFLPSLVVCVAKPEILQPLSLPGQRTRIPAECQPWGTAGLRTPALSPPLPLSRPSLSSRCTSSAFPIHWEKKKMKKSNPQALPLTTSRLYLGLQLSCALL